MILYYSSSCLRFMEVVLIIFHHHCHFSHFHNNMYSCIFFHKLTNIDPFHLYLSIIQLQFHYHLLYQIIQIILSLHSFVFVNLVLVLLVPLQKMVIHQSTEVDAHIIQLLYFIYDLSIFRQLVALVSMNALLSI